MNDTKHCTICGEVKPLADFYRAAGMRDGHRNDCKSCNLAAKRASYDTATAVARVTKWRDDNPERFAA